ncbi:MAG TPA: aminotransferase class IV [bacterium]
MRPLAEPATGALPDASRLHGCFETMRAYAGRIFRLEGHLDRLAASAKYLGAPMPDRARLARRLTRSLERAGIKEAIVRVALMPEAGRRASRAAVVVQPARMPTSEQYRRGVAVAVVPTRAFQIGAVDARSKFSARLGNVMAILDAQVRGANEALFMDARGYITESTASNFGIVWRGAVLTPPCWQGLLWGITREVLFEAAGRLQVPMREQPLTRHELYNADEAFLTSTTKEVLPVSRIDGRLVGTGRPGAVSRGLHLEFRALVAKELGVRMRRARLAGRG